MSRLIYRSLIVLGAAGVLAAQGVSAQQAAQAVQAGQAQRAQAPLPVLNPPPTVANAAYGLHPRQVIDFWKSTSAEPAPLVVFIHGGGWQAGDKTGIGNARLKRILGAGFAAASINYRYTQQAQADGIVPPVKAPLHDAARAIQFIRSHAAEWNIDPKRVGATGGSAGACTSLWLAFHPDLADATSSDPIARQSTRLQAAAVIGAQTSLDPHQMREWMPNMTYGAHAFGFRTADTDRKAEFQRFHEGRDSVLHFIREYSPYEQAGEGDPPIFMEYPTQDKPAVVGETQKDPTHSAVFGLTLQKKLQAAGVEARLSYPGALDPDFTDSLDFLLKKLAK